MTLDRYKDRPFLLLLDSYVLDVIGQLPPAQQEALAKLEPKLQENFGATAGWREIVEEQLGLLPTGRLGIEMVWASYQETEKSAGRDSSPGPFVHDFVAQNFPALLEDD